jgi:nicotinamidase-related amidase
MLPPSVQKNDSALVFIEFQHEWLSEEGVLQKRLVIDKECFRKSVIQASRVLETARSVGWNIAHAGLDFSDDREFLLFGRGENKFGLRGAIPKAGTWDRIGSSFVEPFVPRDGEFVVKGRSGASTLKNSTLDPFLRNNGINTIFLMGYATHICVESTLREAHDLGYNAYIVGDACAAFEKNQQDYVLENIVHHFGEKIDAQSLIMHMMGS